MSQSRPTALDASGPQSRIAAARERAASVRRGIALAAVASFGAGLVAVRASHPAAATGSSGLAAPASLVAEIQGSPLGGGSIAPASGPSQASTSTS